MNRIAIVGSGLAGLSAAERLRELGFTDEIVILGSEGSGPYLRPALARQFLTDALSLAELEIESFEKLDAIWRLGTTVSRLDWRQRVLHLPGAEQLAYDGLIVATGVEARRLDGGIHGDPRVVTLRTVADATRLKRALSGNRYPVVVIGTGFIGCEVASSLREIGREVTMVGRSSHLMSDLLGPELGQRLTDLHRDHEVDLEMGVTVEGWARRKLSLGVRLSNGKTIEAACVVVAVGSVPAVDWLRDADVKVDGGVVCDATCHVAGLDDVVAAGDVAVWPNLRFDNKPRRTEHWTNAIEMGRAAAESLLTGRSSAQPFMPVPRFWSEQHGVRIHAVGVPRLGTRRVALHDRTRGGGSVTGFVRGERLVGVIGFNSSAAVTAYGDELNRRPPVSNVSTSPQHRPQRRVSFQEAARAAGG